MNTTISSATSPPGRAGSEVPRRDDRGRLRTIVRWGGDAVALALLAAVLVWSADRDGGRHVVALFGFAVLAAAFLPWSVAEVRRWPRIAGWMLLGFMAGGLISIAFAAERSSFLVPAMTFSAVVSTGTAAHRVWRRRWGPAAVLAMVLVGFGLYWQRSFLQWWGSAGGPARWLALSWHNQSAVLMAAFGMVFLGLAAAGRRLLVVAGVLGAGAALAGVWLSASRGGVLAAVLGLVVLTVVAVRARGLLRGLGVVAASIAVTVAVVGWLSFVRTDVPARTSSGAGTGRVEQPLFERETPAAGNAVRRLQHMQAALGMFLDAPVTGQGLGSYRALAIRWSAPDANLPANAHNRYVEVLGEGGLIMGLPLLGLVAAVGLVAIGALRGTPRVPDGRGEMTIDEVRPALAAGLAGAAIVVAAHSVIDFDWTYPVLPALVAIAAGALAADRTPDRTGSTRTALAVAAVVVTGALLSVGAGAHLLERDQAGLNLQDPAGELAGAFLPWQSGRGVTIALELSDRGDHAEASRVLDRVGRWAPGRVSLPTERAVVAYRAGTATAQDLSDTLHVGDDWFSSFNLAARVLMEGGDHEAAQQVLRTAIDGHDRYPGWDLGIEEAKSYELLIRSLAATGACPAARSVATEAPALPDRDAMAVWRDRCG